MFTFSIFGTPKGKLEVESWWFLEGGGANIVMLRTLKFCANLWLMADLQIPEHFADNTQPSMHQRITATR